MTEIEKVKGREAESRSQIIGGRMNLRGISRRRITTVVVGIVLFVIGLDLLYFAWGHQLVDAMYKKEAIRPLNAIIEYQNLYSPAHYRKAADETVLSLNLFVLLSALGFYAIPRIFGSKTNRLILAGLLWIDFCFLAAHLTGSEYWSLSRDRAIPEYFQYAKELFLVAAFFYLFRKSKQALHLWFGFIFLVILADDFLRIHETSSFSLAGISDLASLSERTGVTGKNFWEIAIFGAAGFVGFLAFLLAFWKSGPEPRRLARTLLPWLFVLFFMAAGVDFIQNFPLFTPVYNITTIIEDWGEMLALSMICYLFIKDMRKLGAEAA